MKKKQKFSRSVRRAAAAWCREQYPVPTVCYDGTSTIAIILDTDADSKVRPIMAVAVRYNPNDEALGLPYSREKGKQLALAKAYTRLGLKLLSHGELTWALETVNVARQEIKISWSDR